MSDKIKYWKTDFKGKMHVKSITGFHPNLFKGTEEEYNDIYENHLKGREDEFKVIGVHCFDTWEEYLKKFKYLG